MKRIILGVFVIAILSAITVFWKNYYRETNGYCYAEDRRLTDDEIVDAAVMKLLQNLDNEYQSLLPEEQATRFRYETLEEFYNHNPRCCGNSDKNGKSKYPPPPVKAWNPNMFLRNILYKYKVGGEESNRSVKIWVDFCAERVTSDTSWMQDKSAYQDIWGIGRPTRISPDVESRKNLKDRRRK